MQLKVPHLAAKAVGEEMGQDFLSCRRGTRGRLWDKRWASRPRVRSSEFGMRRRKSLDMPGRECGDVRERALAHPGEHEAALGCGDLYFRFLVRSRFYRRFHDRLIRRLIPRRRFLFLLRFGHRLLLVAAVGRYPSPGLIGSAPSPRMLTYFWYRYRLCRSFPVNSFTMPSFCSFPKAAATVG